jgi:anti-sigma factor RsiW
VDHCASDTLDGRAPEPPPQAAADKDTAAATTAVSAQPRVSRCLGLALAVRGLVGNEDMPSSLLFETGA